MKSLTIIEQKDGNYFTFYDNDQGSILREFEGFEYGLVDESIDDVSGPYGSVYVNSKFNKRQVAIKGDLVSPNVFALRRTLNSALRQTGVIKLIKFTTYDDLLLQFEAEITKVVNPYTHMIHEFLIEAIAPDWRFYSQELKTFDIAISFVKGGATIPATIPMAITKDTGTSTTETNIINNLGSEVTDPIFTITGPCSNPVMRNTVTGEEFTITEPLISGDELIIDVKNRTVILNGVTNWYQYFSGDFWSIVPGENEIRFFADDFVIDETNLSMTYRDAYGGI